jgi:hypothetical protein
MGPGVTAIDNHPYNFFQQKTYMQQNVSVNISQMQSEPL